MRKLGIDLVDEVGKIGCGFVIDVFEEHDGLEVLGEILDLSLLQLSLKDLDDIFFFGTLYLLGQIDNFLFGFDKPLDIFAYLVDFHMIHSDDFLTNGFDFDIRLISHIIDKVTNGKFGTLAQNVQNLFAFDKT